MSAKVDVSSHHKAISCSIMSWKVLFRFSLMLENIKIIGPLLILGVIYKQRNIEDPIIPCKEQNGCWWIIFVFRVVWDLYLWQFEQASFIRARQSYFMPLKSCRIAQGDMGILFRPRAAWNITNVKTWSRYAGTCMYINFSIILSLLIDIKACFCLNSLYAVICKLGAFEHIVIIDAKVRPF